MYPPGEGPSERATQARTSEDKGDALLAGLSTKLSPAARKSLTEAAQRNPEAARLMREAALAMRRHDVNSAYELLRKVAAVDSKVIAVHAGLGWVYLMKGEFGHSVEELRKGTRISSRTAGHIPNSGI